MNPRWNRQLSGQFDDEHLFYWDRGRPARLKQRLESTVREFVNLNNEAFNRCGRDARGPSMRMRSSRR